MPNNGKQMHTPPEFTIAVMCEDARYAVVPCDELGLCDVPTKGTHNTMSGAIRAAWRDYERRVRAYEELDITRSDAQGIVDAEIMTAGKEWRSLRLYKPSAALSSGRRE